MLSLLLQELDLKIRAIDRLLHSPIPLRHHPSLNTLWTGLIIEELCRLGATTFCIAPGMPWAPLAFVPVCACTFVPVSMSACGWDWLMQNAGQEQVLLMVLN